MPTRPDIEPPKTVTQAAFARAMGCDDTCIRRYIKEGKMHPPAVVFKDNGKVKHLLYDLAREQYLTARQNVELKFAGSGGGPAVGKGAINPATRGAAAAEPGPGEHPPLRPQGHGGHLQTGDGSGSHLEPAAELPMDSEGLRVGTMAELKKREAQLNVKKKEIEIDEIQGTLVKSEAVFKALYVTGQEINNRFQAIADRLTDAVLAATTRPEVHGLITDEINAALNDVADLLGSVDITADRSAGAAKGQK